MEDALCAQPFRCLVHVETARVDAEVDEAEEGGCSDDDEQATGDQRPSPTAIIMEGP